jgi:hypothetical protein
MGQASTPRFRLLWGILIGVSVSIGLFVFALVAPLTRVALSRGVVPPAPLAARPSLRLLAQCLTVPERNTADS